MKRLVLAGTLLLGVAAAHADTFPPAPADARFEALIFSFGDLSASMPMGEALVIHEDGSITVDWARLRAYATLYPIDRAHWPANETTLLVHALLALHDGRVTEVKP